MEILPNLRNLRKAEIYAKLSKDSNSGLKLDFKKSISYRKDLKSEHSLTAR